MNSTLVIRPMRRTDFPSILTIQEMCYTELIPETEQSLLAKLQAAPFSCHVASLLGSQGEQVIGYLIAVPWHFENPPLLNMQTCEIPDDADTLYLHDMAVMPAARKAGAGKALVEKFIDQIAELNFQSASLIAVQNSKAYWQRFGFQPVTKTAALQAKLLSYGAGVEYMRRIG